MPYLVVAVESNSKRTGPSKERNDTRTWKCRDLRQARSKLKALIWAREMSGNMWWSCKILHNGTVVE